MLPLEHSSNLRGALNTIWRVKPNPGTNLKAFLIDRVRSFGLVVAIGFLLMVSLAVTAALAAQNGWLARYAPSVPALWSGVRMFVSLIVTTLVFAPCSAFCRTSVSAGAM